MTSAGGPWRPCRGQSARPRQAAESSPRLLATIQFLDEDTQCRQLCYGPYPSWTQVQEHFAELRGLL